VGTAKFQLLASNKLVGFEQGMSAIDQRRAVRNNETLLDSVIADLYRKSKAESFGISSVEFVAIVEEVSAKDIPQASASERLELCKTLRVDDLALARACAAGNERAWEAFMLRFREKLYDIARQITREDSAGRELADSVYANLYGTKTREGERVSKLSSYRGRGSLEGWLRTVLAQEYVNTYRKQRRLVSLDEESEEGVQFSASANEPAAVVDSKLEPAVDDVLRSLSPEDRFVLASYFLDQRTLAQIARALSVHESTISRKIEKRTKAIRKQVLKNLIGRGMSRRHAEEALSFDIRDLALDIRASLAQDSLPGAFSGKGAKAGEGGS
jgi:RNA polymerase sigma-70 factor, ECF subfamily